MTRIRDHNIDISPVARPARALSSLEAVTGHMFKAWIARMKSNRAIQSLGLFGMLAGSLAVYWLVYALAPELHRNYFQGEDRLVEWMTFMFFFLSAIMTLYTIKYSDKTSRDLCYLIIMGCFLLICAGEEISWGQRFFNFQTPELLMNINDQNEFNLHNISFEFIHPYGIMSWFMSLFGIAIPLFLWKRAANPDSTLRWYLSPLILVPSFAFPLIIRSTDDFVQSMIVQYSGSDMVKSYTLQTAELQELYWGVCLFLAMTSIFIFRKHTVKTKTIY